MSTASAERSFSPMRRVKSYLRSTMYTERLTGLAHENMHVATTYYRLKISENLSQC